MLKGWRGRIIIVEEIINKFKEQLTLDGKKRVLEDREKLTSQMLKIKADPEEYTKENLIEPLLRSINIKKVKEVHFKGIRGELRKADYYLENTKGIHFLAEVKPLNSDLFEKIPNGAINQIKGLFRLAEVQKQYSFGIATDGLTWIFIDKESNIVFNLNFILQFNSIKEILTGKEQVSLQKVEEKISKKFYDWYNALLHGGKYKDHENKTKHIAESDSLVENIYNVQSKDEREQIAQILMNRLIFVKFLQSKGVINFDIMEYVSQLSEDIMNEKLKQLFFQVLNTEKNQRINIDSKFEDIPYLNGSLFFRAKVESKNINYIVKSEVLGEVISFLDSFKFIHSEVDKDSFVLDPEILGYIFERAMTATDRKGTGSYLSLIHI